MTRVEELERERDEWKRVAAQRAEEIASHERESARLLGWLAKVQRAQRESAVASTETTVYIDAAIAGAPCGHQPNCTVTAEGCSCGYLNALAGKPPSTTTRYLFDASDNAAGAPDSPPSTTKGG